MGISFIVLAVLLIVRLVKYLASPTYPERFEAVNYNQNKQENKAEEPAGEPFFTNAPAHWGIITDGFLGSNKNFVERYEENRPDVVVNRRQWMVNSLVLMGKINAALEAERSHKISSSYSDGLLNSKERYATTCCVEKLFEKGIISITGIVIDNYRRFGVMLFDTPVPMAYINQLREYFINDGYQDLIYFSVTDPATVSTERALKFENFNKSCFNYNGAKQGKINWSYNQYAMWWASEAEPGLDQSAVKDDIRVCLDMIDFHNSYALGILSFAFGIKKDNTRTRLPEYDEVLIKGPEGVEVIISLSARQGINFHFPVEPTFEKYRNKFMKVYLNFCYDIRAQILENDLPDDDFETVSTLVWYDNLLKEAQRAEQRVNVLGLLTKSVSN